MYNISILYINYIYIYVCVYLFLRTTSMSINGYQPAP